MKMKENRKYPRYGIASMAGIYLSGSEEPMEAFVSSIGRGGIGIYSPKRIEAGEDLMVKIGMVVNAIVIALLLAYYFSY